MRPARIIALTGLVVGLIVLLAWLTGGLDEIQVWAAARQHEVQGMMAGVVRRLRAGEPGASLALMVLCFGYGFVHAVGPGHGKVLIGGYGFGTQVPFGRLAVLSVISSLAQALTAVLLVWAGITVFGLSREALIALSEERMADIGAIMIGLIGMWLIWRGARMIQRATQTRHIAGNADHHHYSDHGTCGCGHVHGPSPRQVVRTRSLRDAVVLITGIAMRPCTGALFLLILSWRFGIFATGIAGAFAMGLGTASVTLLVAALSVWARRGSFAILPEGGRLASAARWLPGVMQLGAGALIATLAFGMVV